MAEGLGIKTALCGAPQRRWLGHRPALGGGGRRRGAGCWGAGQCRWTVGAAAAPPDGALASTSRRGAPRGRRGLGRQRAPVGGGRRWGASPAGTSRRQGRPALVGAARHGRWEAPIDTGADRHRRRVPAGTLAAPAPTWRARRRGAERCRQRPAPPGAAGGCPVGAPWVPPPSRVPRGHRHKSQIYYMLAFAHTGGTFHPPENARILCSGRRFPTASCAPKKLPESEMKPQAAQFGPGCEQLPPPAADSRALQRPPIAALSRFSGPGKAHGLAATCRELAGARNPKRALSTRAWCSQTAKMIVSCAAWAARGPSSRAR